MTFKNNSFVQESIKTMPYNDFIDDVFQGTIMIFRQVESVLNFCKLSEDYIQTFLATDQPLSFHLDLNEDDYLKQTSALIQAFQKEDALKQAFQAILKTFSLNVDETFWDRLVLRIVLSGKLQDKARFSKVGFHRDTWGSNIYNQVNWWFPVLPMQEGTSTIVFYPKYWTQKIKNTTDTWRFSDYLKEWKESQETGFKVRYPTTPQALETIDETDATPMQLDPGDLLCFSSAHLHASSMNQSRYSRFSVETRTILLSDIENNKKAPNIDNQGTELMYRWFSSINNQTSLSKTMNKNQTQ